MRKFIVVLALFLGVILVIFSFSEIQNIVETLQRASPVFLVLAILFQLVWFLVLGSTFKSIFGLLGLKESRIRLILIAAAGSFVNIVTTSAGVGSLAVFISDGNAHGHPAGKVTVASALYLLLDEAAFLCVLALGMVVLIRRNHLGIGEVTAALFLLAIASVLASLLYLGYRSAEALGNTLAAMARFVNRIVRPFIRRDYLSEERAHNFATEVASGLGALPQKPQSLVPPFLLSLANKILLMGILVCSFLAYDVPFSAGTIVGGFAIGYLFLIVSPTPSGIGVVEGVMSIALGTLRVDFSQAVVVTLTYRAVTFWLPLAIGALALRTLNMNKPTMMPGVKM